MKRALLLCIALLASPAGAAPTDGPDCTVIAGTRAHVPGGAQDGVTAVLADGVIKALGAEIAGLSAPADGGVTWNGRRCAWVDGSAAQLSAGLIEPHSTLGLVEVSMEAGTRHQDAGGSQPVRAHVRVIDGYDPLSSLIPVARREGITAAVLQPDGGSFSGAAAAVRLTGTTQSAAIVRGAGGKQVGRDVAIRAHLSGGASFAARLSNLRAVLTEAATYRSNPAAWSAGMGTRADAPPGQSLQALSDALSTGRPLIVSADRASDLEALASFAVEMGVQLVIEGAAEGWLVADLLANAGVAVIIDPFVYGPGGFEQLHARADNGALLVSAGVPVMISTRSAHFARKLRQMAGNAVRGGMSHHDALAAITSVPSQVFGLSDLGRLRVGSTADVVLWTGDPLEVDSWPTHVWIGGVSQSLDSRQTRLRDRYRTLPGSPTAPLSLPE